MANLQFEDFCQKVCQMLRWKAAWGPVSAELTAHLEDHAAALEARGLSSEEAAAQAVTAMGEPEELGRQLDRAPASAVPLCGGHQHNIGLSSGRLHPCPSPLVAGFRKNRSCPACCS